MQNLGVVASTVKGALAPSTDGTFTYTPDFLFYGTDTFTYRANDGDLDSNLATVNITVIPLDTDNDGIPDSWEQANGLDIADNDAADDPDGDGFSNLVEYLRGTDPNDPNSHPPRTMPWIPLLLLDD